MPRVSVFMPTYNCGEYLKDSIESILNQTYEDFELIIVNDGSTDNSREILEEYRKKDSRVHIYHNDGNQGIVYTRNRGLELCQCEYTALMDADDISVKDRLEHSVRFMDEHKDVALFAGSNKYFDKKEAIIAADDKFFNEEIIETSYLKAKLFIGSPFLNDVVIYRTNFVKENKIKYRSFRCCQDYAFFQDMIIAGGKVCMTNKIFTNIRFNPTGITSTLKKNEEYRFYVYDSVHLIFLDYLGISLPEEEKRVFLCMQRKTTGGSYERFGKEESKLLKRACNGVKEQCKKLDCSQEIDFWLDRAYRSLRYLPPLRKYAGELYHKIKK